MPAPRHRYFIVYKPYGFLSQFTPKEGWEGLGSLGPFPGDVYPVGRLDVDSEGLLLLTNDPDIHHRLTDPKFRHERTYLVQVEGVPGESQLDHLRKGIPIQGKKTLPAEVRLLTSDPQVPDRPVPIRHRKSVPTSWLELILTEGRNRQVRRMTAAVGCPTLRLIRISQGPLRLSVLLNGDVRELTPEDALELRKVVGVTERPRRRIAGPRRGKRSPRR